MRKLKKWHIATIILSSILIIIGISALVIWAVIYRNQSDKQYEYGDIGNLQPIEWVIADTWYNNDERVNSIDINMLFGKNYVNNAVYTSKNENIISFNGNTATIQSLGKATLVQTVGENSKEFECKVISGVNVTNLQQLLKAVNDDKIVTAQQKDIAIPITNSLKLTTDYYGNGYKLIRVNNEDGGNYYYNRLFDISGISVAIRDAHLIGKKIEPNETFTLGEFGIGGILIGFDSADGIRGGGIVENCILENAQRLIFLNQSDVNIKGCFMRNAADACVSVETSTGKGCNLTMENNVVMDASVAGILFWSSNKNADKDNFANLTVKGFLDIYNWKGMDSAQIVPNSEGIASTVNPIIASALNGNQYDSYMYFIGEKKYIHCGIVAISMSGQNSPVIKGMESGYVNRTFPLPSLAKPFIQTCRVIGYDKDPRILPEKTPDFTTIFADLREGRK